MKQRKENHRSQQQKEQLGLTRSRHPFLAGVDDGWTIVHFALTESCVVSVALIIRCLRFLETKLNREV